MTTYLDMHDYYLQFQAFGVNCSVRFYCDAVSKLFEKSENPFSSKYFSSKSQSHSPVTLTDQGSWFSCPGLLKVNITLAILVLEFGYFRRAVEKLEAISLFSTVLTSAAKCFC